jgi:hypothetical protein
MASEDENGTLRLAIRYCRAACPLPPSELPLAVIRGMPHRLLLNSTPLPELAMSDDPYPKCEALPMKDGGGWYIVVTPTKHGAPYEVYGLTSETEALDWIDAVHLCEKHNGAGTMCNVWPRGH